MIVIVHHLKNVALDPSDSQAGDAFRIRFNADAVKAMAIYQNPTEALAYEQVATVTLEFERNRDDALEKAFMLTNHIDTAWWDNAGVERTDATKTHRSTSVGDIMQVGERFFLVSNFGFTEM